MNRFLLILGLCAAGGSGGALGADLPYRTDINPALRYYQAYLAAPQLAEADDHYLFVTDWRGHHLEPRFGELLAKFDPQFRIVDAAAHAKVPCDWGIDLTEGPAALLPGLAPAKRVAQTARLRVLWHLQNGKQDEARDELLAAFALGRNLSRDGVLISALVQIAIESILDSAVTENFYRWTPETLKQVGEGFDAAPARGTIAQCVPTEKSAFYGWLLRKIEALQKVEALQKDHPNTDAQMLEQMRVLFESMTGDNPADPSFIERLVDAGGGTSQGVLRLIRELDPWYDRVSGILSAPYSKQNEEQMKQFMRDKDNSPNPLVREFFNAYEKCRIKEFVVQARLAMIHAAIEYKLHGEAGLKTVKDPFGTGPFRYERFTLEGKDRGFKLTAAYAGRGQPESLIFVEKEGPPFQTDGPHIGEPIEPAATEN